MTKPLQPIKEKIYELSELIFIYKFGDYLKKNEVVIKKGEIVFDNIISTYNELQNLKNFLSNYKNEMNKYLNNIKIEMDKIIITDIHSFRKDTYEILDSIKNAPIYPKSL